MSKLFKCSVCGYIHEGVVAPDVCPKCGQPSEKYAELGDDAAKLVTRSRATNRYHTQVLELLARASEISDKGIEDALDPSCVKIFQDVVASAKVLEAKIKAEIAGHVGKGKWG